MPIRQWAIAKTITKPHYEPKKSRDQQGDQIPFARFDPRPPKKIEEGKSEMKIDKKFVYENIEPHSS